MLTQHLLVVHEGMGSAWVRSRLAMNSSGCGGIIWLSVGTMYHSERPRPTYECYVSLSIPIPFFAFAVVLLALLAFLEHPGPDVGRTVQHRNSRRLARIQKANRLDISEVHFL